VRWLNEYDVTGLAGAAVVVGDEQGDGVGAGGGEGVDDGGRGGGHYGGFIAPVPAEGEGITAGVIGVGAESDRLVA